MKKQPDRTLVLAKALGNYGYPAKQNLITPVVEGKPEEVFPKDGPNNFVIAEGFNYMVPAHLCEGEKKMFEKVKDAKKSKPVSGD